MSTKKILYATDFSQTSEHALQYATWLAECTGAELCIAFVSEREQYPVGEHFEEQPEPNPQELAQLESVVPHDKTIQFEHRILYGEPGSVEVTRPAKVLVDFAKKEDFDMIVLGTHGRTGLSHLVMGSVAEAVIRHADCPVVTVREGRELSE